jgi:hypothetical protein
MQRMISRPLTLIAAAGYELWAVAGVCVMQRAGVRHADHSSAVDSAWGYRGV